MIQRRASRQIQIGPVAIGGGAPISIQSMTNTPTSDAVATLAQIDLLHRAGCQIIRVAVPDADAAHALVEIVRQSPLPVVADIHFDYRLALSALEAGVAGLRLNPGNIGSRRRVAAVANAARLQNVPIRIGVNGGSLDKHLRHAVEQGQSTLPQAMVQSALDHIAILEELDFHNIKVSLKASDVVATVAAYRLLADRCDYPFHVGVTEAGTVRSGTLKSAIGIGSLLLDGLCDTIRVSLTGPVEEEIRVGLELLRAVGERRDAPELISCPTCGRVGIDLEQLAAQVEEILRDVTRPIRVAVMGCEVNGPGEAREADLGIAGAGPGRCAIFRKGRIVLQCEETRVLEVFRQELDALLARLDAQEESSTPGKK